MRREIVVVTSGVALSFCILTSCDTPVGQGAGWGAATGAIIGGAATGHARWAAVGAAAGAAAGALTGAIIQENQAARVMARRRPAAFHMLAGPERQVFITVLPRDASMIFAAFRPVGLRVT